MNNVWEPVLWPLSRWAESSQRTACRNAMIASTALAARRRQHDETQAYVGQVIAHRARRADQHGDARADHPAARLG